METEHSVISPRQDIPARAQPPVTLPSRQLCVYMMDLLSIVPYYTGHLASALEERSDVRLSVAAITYYLDREYFSRQKFKLHPGLDWVSNFAVRPAGLRRSLKLQEYIVNLCALLSRLCVLRPDILHVQFLPMLIWGAPLELWFLRCVKRLGIRIVYTVHNVLPQGTGDQRRSLFKKLYRIPDALICHDQVARERLIREFDVAPHRVTVIPHGPLLTPDRAISADRAREELAVAKDEFLVLWQGILRPYKGVPFLLRAWRRVQAKNPSARLAIVGAADRDGVRSVADDVRKLGIEDSVRIEMRFVTERELSLYYSAADVLVYPYSEITTSGALMTGLGHGKALVTTKLEAFQSVLTDRRDALMVEYGDVEALAETILTLADQPALRDQLGAAAKRTHGQWQSWPEIAANTTALYRAIAET